jgi:hypothetical protein
MTLANSPGSHLYLAGPTTLSGFDKITRLHPAASARALRLETRRTCTGAVRRSSQPRSRRIISTSRIPTSTTAASA